nr:MAG TPA: tail sheath protein [Bacteriophage sp.]
MGFPGAKITVSNGNLLREITALDAVPCLVATVKEVGNINALRPIYNLQDAEQKGYEKDKEPFMWGLIKEYYQELGGKQLLYIYGTKADKTMESVLDVTSADGLQNALRQSNGAINMVAVARSPEAAYNAGTDFLDTDVAKAVAKAKILAETQQSKNMPLRIFIEGRVANEEATNNYKPKEQANGYAAVVLGGTTKGNGSAAVSLALARAVKYPAHVKLGSGQNGALTAENIYIGSKPIEKINEMETLHDAGFLTFHHRTGVAGYFFGVDNMCSDDDFRILVHGRVIDKAQRIASIAFQPFVENFVTLKSNGSINDSEASYIENVIESSLWAGLRGQVSDIAVEVDRSVNLANTSNLPVDIKVLPLGYLTWINIRLGLTATINK